jgi:hypothetical protein
LIQALPDTCDNILEKTQKTIYYIDNDVRSKYTQSIIINNIRDMLLHPNTDIYTVNESLCDPTNIPNRITAGHLYTCPDEIKYIPNKKPRELITNMNQQEISFRTQIISDISYRLDDRNYRTHLQSLRAYLNPLIIEQIQIFINQFQDNCQILDRILREKSSKNELDIKDKYLVPIDQYYTTKCFYFNEVFGISKKRDLIKKNLLNIANDYYWYMEKINITLDVIEIFINSELNIPIQTITFDIYTGETLSSNRDHIPNIDKFIEMITQYHPPEDYDDDVVPDEEDNDF